eukprot:COSAG06_NODE_2547_length_6695_cov_5.498636_3_plen_163_part_00
MLTCYNTFDPKEPLYPVMNYAKYGVAEHGVIKGARNACLFSSHFLLAQDRLVCQDRLGTNTRKLKEKCMFYAGEKAYKEQLVQGGPLACGICSKKLDSYTGGVWMGIGKNCSDHTISIAGYGTSEDGLPYWCAYLLPAYLNLSPVVCLSTTCRLSSVVCRLS